MIHVPDIVVIFGVVYFQNQQEHFDNVDGKTFDCKHCRKKFLKQSSLSKHLQTHDGLNCSICGKKFCSFSSLNKHKLEHAKKEKDLKLKCRRCPNIFKKNQLLKNHFVSCHLKYEDIENLSYRVFPCDVCKKIFPDNKKLVKHAHVHAGDKLFPCTFCGKTFSVKFNCRTHEMMHQNNNYSHRCDVCGNEFITKRDLGNHMKTHNKNFDVFNTQLPLNVPVPVSIKKVTPVNVEPTNNINSTNEPVEGLIYEYNEIKIYRNDLSQTDVEQADIQ